MYVCEACARNMPRAANQFFVTQSRGIWRTLLLLLLLLPFLFYIRALAGRLGRQRTPPPPSGLIACLLLMDAAAVATAPAPAASGSCQGVQG